MGHNDNLKFSRAMFVDSESGLCNTVQEQLQSAFFTLCQMYDK